MSFSPRSPKLRGVLGEGEEQVQETPGGLFCLFVCSPSFSP